MDIKQLRELEAKATANQGDGICISSTDEMEYKCAVLRAAPYLFAVVEAAEAVLDDPCYSEMYQGERDKLRTALSDFRNAK